MNQYCLNKNKELDTCSECMSFKQVGEQRYNMTKNINFGNIIIGVWFCWACKKQWFPSQIKKLYEASLIKTNKFFFVCPTCNSDVAYDEEA